MRSVKNRVSTQMCGLFNSQVKAQVRIRTRYQIENEFFPSLKVQIWSLIDDKIWFQDNGSKARGWNREVFL